MRLKQRLVAGGLCWEFISETELTCSVLIRENTLDQHLWKGEGGNRIDRGKPHCHLGAQEPIQAHQTCPALAWPFILLPPFDIDVWLWVRQFLKGLTAKGCLLTALPVAGMMKSALQGDLGIWSHVHHLREGLWMCANGLQLWLWAVYNFYGHDYWRLLSFHPCSSFLLCDVLNPLYYAIFSSFLRNHNKILFF